MISAGCFTAEAAVVRGGRLFNAGRYGEAFAAMEDSAQLFTSSNAATLIVMASYLAMFVACPDVDPRRRIERIREIAAGLLAAAADESIMSMAPRDAVGAFLRVAELEVLFGSWSCAIAILERGLEAAKQHTQGSERDACCNSLISALLWCVVSLEGLQRARRAFDGILQRGLPSAKLIGEVGLRYAALECSVKAYDRARKILVACSAKQHAATPSGKVYWATWERFEVAHGDASTYEDLQRTKRNVAAKFSAQQVVFNTAIETQTTKGFAAAAAAGSGVTPVGGADGAAGTFPAKKSA
jgi:pre-mRNA-splicing factor SYF1